MREIAAGCLVIVGIFLASGSVLFYVLAGGYVDWTVPAGVAVGAGLIFAGRWIIKNNRGYRA